MSQDQVFKDEIKKASDFKFGTTVANVFDDMVNRSVPYYGEMQRMTAELAADHAKEGSYVYDLGCSTGTTMIGMNTLVPENIEFIGVDDSDQMLEKWALIARNYTFHLIFTAKVRLMQNVVPLAVDNQSCIQQLKINYTIKQKNKNNDLNLIFKKIGLRKC